MAFVNDMPVDMLDMQEKEEVVTHIVGEFLNESYAKGPAISINSDAFTSRGVRESGGPRRVRV